MDSAACVVRNRQLVAAAAEERFTGAKGTGAYPARSIEYCLDAAGIGKDDVDVIAHGFDYDRFRKYFATGSEHFAHALSGQNMMVALKRDGFTDVGARFRPVVHHTAHAASAYLATDYDSALSIVSDGMGEISSFTVCRIRHGRFEDLHRQGIESSLGILYSIVTRYLGYMFNSDEYKVMGMAAYGDPARFADFFKRFMATADGRIAIGWPKGALSRGNEGYPDALNFLETSLGVAPRDPSTEIEDAHTDVAASFQARFSELLTAVTHHWMQATGERALCLSGGTFLNCLANQSISELPNVEQMFVPPAAGDDGTAIGAALYVGGERLRTPYTPYSGPSYDEEEVDRALAATEGAAGIVWQHVGPTEEYIDMAARDIAEDGILAWFAGRMEFGPRALGNRSILALPAGTDIKDRLNRIVKLREPFRPFAPAILDSDYTDVFETPAYHPSRYMLSTARVRSDKKEAIRGAVHADGTARVQIVRRDDNELFWRLLTRVKHYTGLGCVINTSYNVKGQPVIMDPRNAIDSFVRMSLTRLYIQGFRVSQSRDAP
jgi:carbamoyltransferase